MENWWDLAKIIGVFGEGSGEGLFAKKSLPGYAYITLTRVSPYLLCDQLGQIHHFKLFGFAHHVARIFEHGDAVRAGGNKSLGARVHSLGNASFANRSPALVSIQTLPPPPPQHRLFLRLRESSLRLGTGNRCDQVAGRVIDFVVTPQIARVMHGHRTSRIPREFQFSVSHRLSENLRVVENFPFSAQVGILVFECVKAVGRSDDDLFHAFGIVKINVGLRHLLKELLVADLADRLSTAALLVADNAEAYSRGLQGLCNRPGDLLAPDVVTRGTADREKILGGFRNEVTRP